MKHINRDERLEKRKGSGPQEEERVTIIREQEAVRRLGIPALMKTEKLDSNSTSTGSESRHAVKVASSDSNKVIKISTERDFPTLR